MTFNRMQYRNSRSRVAGLVMLIAANTTLFLARPTHFLTPDRLDALKGLMMGLAIAFLILSLVQARRCQEDSTQSGA